MQAQNVIFRVEVEDSPLALVLVFDRKSDYVMIPWQDAMRLADTLDQVIVDVGSSFVRRPQRIVIDEQEQVRLGHHDGYVTLFTCWTDRIKFVSIEAVALVSQAIRKVAHTAQLEDRGIIIQYNREGLIKKIHDLRNGITQVVRQ